jgi:hypothetical protein
MGRDGSLFSAGYPDNSPGRARFLLRALEASPYHPAETVARTVEDGLGGFLACAE